MKTFERNQKAEESRFVLIPKDTTLPCGIESVDTYVNTLNVGDNKGRQYDKYKLKLKVLDPGEYSGKGSSVSVSCNVERREDVGGDGMILDPWGNSAKYIALLHAIGMDFADEAVPLPETEEELKSFAETLVGKVINVTFGTYKFKNDEGKQVEINTAKTFGALNDAQREAIAVPLAEFNAEAAAKSGGGAVNLDEEFNGQF